MLLAVALLPKARVTPGKVAAVRPLPFVHQPVMLVSVVIGEKRGRPYRTSGMKQVFPACQTDKSVSVSTRDGKDDTGMHRATYPRHTQKTQHHSENAMAIVYVQITAAPKAVQADLASVRLLLEVNSCDVLLFVSALPKTRTAALALKRPPRPLVHVTDVGLQLTSMREALFALLARVRRR